MRRKGLSKGLVLGLAVALSTISVCPLFSAACGTGAKTDVSARPAAPRTPAMAGNVVLEWNDVAAKLAVQPALAAIQQARVMAIFHLAVHDAVNGITGK